MEIKIETNEYNFRRFSKPWIAKVDFSQSAQGEFLWGEWIGDARNGSDGILTIDAIPGDIIANGQKDFRNPRNSAPDFSVVHPKGFLEPLGTKADAYKYYLAQKETAPDMDALRKERDTLLARVAEINSILGEEA